MEPHKECLLFSDCCRLLAACFYEPDRELFLEEKVFENLEYLLENFSLEGAAIANRMGNAIRYDTQQQLSVDHAQLFLGPFELRAPPYGSVYIEKKRMVMEDSTLAAADFYLQESLDVSIQEPPDHIAIELEFLSYLCSKEGEAHKAGREKMADGFRETQGRFFIQVMEPWLSEFCAAIKKGTKNHFYLELANCLLEVVKICRHRYNREMAI